MSDERFNIVFKAELVRGIDAAVAKKNLATLFKMSPAAVENLFGGKPVILKKDVSFDTGMQYRTAIKKAGALVDLVPVVAEKPEPKPSQGKAVFSVPVEESESAESKSAAPDSAKPSKETPKEDLDGLSLAPLGPIIAASEKSEVQAADVDTSALSLRAPGNVLDDHEKASEPANLPRISADISLAEPGTAVLKEEERVVVEELDVDITGLSLAAPGADLGAAKRPTPPPAPEVDFDLV